MNTIIFLIVLNIHNVINFNNSHSLNLEKKIKNEIQKQIKYMSLEEKVGQLFNIAIVGKKLDEKYKNLIKKYSISGITFFSYNMSSKKQAKNFILELQKASKIPLFISVDQEGGRITRYKYNNFAPPSPYLMGKINNLKISKKIAKYIAEDLKEVGVNLNLAPLADVLSNNKNYAIFDRAFSNNPKIVSKHVNSFVNAFHSNNIIATIKHFPGQGDFSQDTHKTLPISKTSLETIEKRELLPFKNAIKNNVYAIMTSHSIFASLDHKYPATLSKKILTDILRNKLKYKHIILSDGLEMQAVLKTFGLKRAVILALNAGVDILTLNWNYKHVKRAINYVLDAVNRNEISIASIDEKLKRILYVKKLFLYKKNNLKKCDNYCVKEKKDFLKEIYKNNIKYLNVKKGELKNKKIYTNIHNLKNPKINYIKDVNNLNNSIIITNKYNKLNKDTKNNNIIILLAPEIGINHKNKMLILHENNKITRDIVKNILK